MRLGLIGLGRIGSFHADTLSQLPAVESLVVTDAVPAATKSRGGAGRRRPSGLAAELCSRSGVDAIVIAAATDGPHRAHPCLGGCGRPRVLREAAVR